MINSTSREPAANCGAWRPITTHEQTQGTPANLDPRGVPRGTGGFARWTIT
jgi:hypothetical protein